MSENMSNDALQTPEPSSPRVHRFTKVPMSEGLSAVMRHMDDLAAEGWQSFHMHEYMPSEGPCFLILSRKVSA